MTEEDNRPKKFVRLVIYRKTEEKPKGAPVTLAYLSRMGRKKDFLRGKCKQTLTIERDSWICGFAVRDYAV